ncbi:MAG: cell division protein FtsQ/DivIB [Rhodobacteraceae bacterium]|nr:cell division protein FtsQ/DivIB [Paracoccaceae bacterium]
MRFDPPISRAPGARPSLRAAPGRPLPGTPRVNPFGAEDYSRAPDPARHPERHGARGWVAGHEPGESVYADDHGPAARAVGAGHARPALAAHDTGPRSARFGARAGPDPRASHGRAGQSAPGRAGTEPNAEVPAARSRARWRGRRSDRDPAPSRLTYRLNRLWLTPAVRRAVTVGLPVALVAFCVGVVVNDPVRRDAVNAIVKDMHTAFIDRPEFRIEGVAVPGVSPELRAAVEGRIDVAFPESSFRVDLEELRRAVIAIDAVAEAELRITGARALEIRLTEREPAVVWRDRSGLHLLDAEGHRIARLAARHARSDLLLIAGEGAPEHVPEALALLEAAAPVTERLRGLVRVGERRWDVVLDRDQRILLPESGAAAALERVMALDRAQDLLARDVAVVDLRLPARPVLRLSEGAVETLHSIRQMPE